jgi:hypothetical protein
MTEPDVSREGETSGSVIIFACLTKGAQQGAETPPSVKRNNKKIKKINIVSSI